MENNTDSNISAQIGTKEPPNKPAGFVFEVKQWLGDHMVMSMSYAEQGMHMKLICIAWQETPPCTLPDDDALISQWLNIAEAAWVKIHKKKVMRAWKTLPNNVEGAGRWVLEGLQRSYIKQLQTSVARTAAANTRWQKEKDQKIQPTDLIELLQTDPKAYVWKMGIELLSSETDEKDARIKIGKWIKQYGEAAVSQTLSELSLKAATVADRFSYVSAALRNYTAKEKQRKAPGRGDLVL